MLAVTDGGIINVNEAILVERRHNSSQEIFELFDYDTRTVDLTSGCPRQVM